MRTKRDLEIIREMVECIRARDKLTPNTENIWDFEDACRVTELSALQMTRVLDFLEKSAPDVEIIWQTNNSFLMRRI